MRKGGTSWRVMRGICRGSGRKMRRGPDIDAGPYFTGRDFTGRGLSATIITDDVDGSASMDSHYYAVKTRRTSVRLPGGEVYQGPGPSTSVRHRPHGAW